MTPITKNIHWVQNRSSTRISRTHTVMLKTNSTSSTSQPYLYTPNQLPLTVCLQRTHQFINVFQGLLQKCLALLQGRQGPTSGHQMFLQSIPRPRGLRTISDQKESWNFLRQDKLILKLQKQLFPHQSHHPNRADQVVLHTNLVNMCFLPMYITGVKGRR